MLLVEEDAHARRAMSLALQREGYGVTEAGNGHDGLVVLRGSEPDVVLVDLVLPDVDGFSVCRQIRRSSSVPVIAMTGRLDGHDVVACLEAGADDCVPASLAAEELAARIRALLRRAGPQAHLHRRFGQGALQVLVDEGVVRHHGGAVALTRTELRLICGLALAYGQVRSREQLVAHVWGDGRRLDGRIVDVHVRRLRIKVEDDPTNPVHVVTVHGRGYRLAV